MKQLHSVAARRGFSLLELVVALGAFAVLVALSVPTFASFMRSRRVESATRELVTDLHHARSLATSRHKTIHVEFSSREYRLVESSSSDVVLRRPIDRTVSMSSSGTPRFFAWGLANPATVTVDDGRAPRDIDVMANGNVSRH